VALHPLAQHPTAGRVCLLRLLCRDWVCATGVTLHHMSLHFLVLVAIFIHIYEMFVCVPPSISLFLLFYVLRWSGKGTSQIGAYYFQLLTKSPIAYITPISSGKWDRWREDWVIVRADAHDRLVLPTEAPTGKHGGWEEISKLQRAFMPIIERIKHLTSHGLMSMMVLYDFLSRHLTPLQIHTRPTWLYMGESDTTWLECGHGSDLDSDMLGTLLGKLSPDPSLADFITPRTACAPMCMDQVMQTKCGRGVTSPRACKSPGQM
jgi:hypothetical protein